jgi:hypothetical protein
VTPRLLELADEARALRSKIPQTDSGKPADEARWRAEADRWIAEAREVVKQLGPEYEERFEAPTRKLAVWEHQGWWTGLQAELEERGNRLRRFVWDLGADSRPPSTRRPKPVRR